MSACRRETKDQKADRKYKEKMQNYARVAESKRNMRVDMRPSVLSRTMTKELFILFFAAAAVVSKSLTKVS